MSRYETFAASTTGRIVLGDFRQLLDGTAVHPITGVTITIAQAVLWLVFTAMALCGLISMIALSLIPEMSVQLLGTEVTGFIISILYLIIGLVMVVGAAVVAAILAGWNIWGIYRSVGEEQRGVIATLIFDGVGAFVANLVGLVLVAIMLIVLCIVVGVTFPSYLGKTPTFDEFLCTAANTTAGGLGAWCPANEGYFVWHAVSLLIMIFLLWALLATYVGRLLTLWRSWILVLVTLIAEGILAIGAIGTGIIAFIILIIRFVYFTPGDMVGHDMLIIAIVVISAAIFTFILWLVGKIVYFPMRFAAPVAATLYDSEKENLTKNEARAKVVASTDSITFIVSGICVLLIGIVFILSFFVLSDFVFAYFGYQCLDNVGAGFVPFDWCSATNMWEASILVYMAMISIALIFFLLIHGLVLFVGDISVPISVWFVRWIKSKKD